MFEMRMFASFCRCLPRIVAVRTAYYPGPIIIDTIVTNANGTLFSGAASTQRKKRQPRLPILPRPRPWGYTNSNAPPRPDYSKRDTTGNRQLINA